MKEMFLNNKRFNKNKQTAHKETAPKITELQNQGKLETKTKCKRKKQAKAG
jgi:hypothetical protein